MRQSYRSLLPLLLCVALLSACGAGSPFRSLRDVLQLGKDAQIERAQLDSRYRYLRVTFQNGRSSLLILGYEDAAPFGTLQTWYSDGGQQTLRLQNGRFVGSSGWPTSIPSWTNVRLSAQPPWNITTSATFTRQRDAMPGYAYGLADTLTVRPIAKPPRTQLHDKPAVRGELAGAPALSEQAARLQWFEETSSDTALPPSHYAVETVDDETTVVYGEQCLTHDFCISWQRWPLYPPTGPDAGKQ